MKDKKIKEIIEDTNREEMSEEERYAYNLKHHGRGTTEIL